MVDLLHNGNFITIMSSFFRDNFLQVDIFYKEVNYEEITQSPSFGLISLFSEVGGFMGLLLGASVLTVCEFLDYVWMLVTASLARRKRVKPLAGGPAVA